MLLVGFAGQTFGMLIMDLRVVNERFSRIGVVQSLLRYVCMPASAIVFVGFIRMFNRVQPFEKWSRTRLVTGSAQARRRERLTGQQLEPTAR